jgi:hypothetical protein
VNNKAKREPFPKLTHKPGKTLNDMQDYEASAENSRQNKRWVAKWEDGWLRGKMGG